MGKLYNFLLGVVVGFLLYHASFNYHVVHANDGMHLVAKQPPRLSDIYMNVRDFTPADWANHPQLILALKQAGKEHVLTDAAADAVNEAVQRGLDNVLPPAE